ncbi:MAG: hypothetical protein P4L92_07385 [Rudaea sp.]|nr:hypothetical protein [Rudaea sp.]
MAMFEFEDSPNAKLDGNRTNQEKMATLVRSPGLVAKNNEAMIPAESPPESSRLRRVMRFMGEHVGKVITGIVTAIVVAIAIPWVKGRLGL